MALLFGGRGGYNHARFGMSQSVQPKSLFLIFRPFLVFHYPLLRRECRVLTLLIHMPLRTLSTSAILVQVGLVISEDGGDAD